MLLLGQLKTFIDQAVTAIPDLKTAIFIVGEEHFRKRITNLTLAQYPVLVALIPSHDGDGSDWDSAQWRNELDFFILKKVNYTARTIQQEFQDYADLQALAIQFRDYLISGQAANTCSWLSKISPNSVSIDPEYNYQECDGYSISLFLNT